LLKIASKHRAVLHKDKLEKYRRQVEGTVRLLSLSYQIYSRLVDILSCIFYMPYLYAAFGIDLSIYYWEGRSIERKGKRN